MGAFSKFFNVFRAKEAPSSHDRDALRMEDQRAEPVLHHGSSATGNVKQGHTGRAIYVLGPSSSGKSTLCDALARYLDLDRTRYVREVARTVMREQGFTRKDVDTYAMQQAIMTAQLKAEQKILERNEVSADADEGCVIMLSDRSAVDPIVYAATSRSPGAEDMRRKLREDKAFQSVLPFYRKSLFSECTDLGREVRSRPMPTIAAYSCSPAGEGMDSRRWGTHTGEPVDLQSKALRNFGRA